MAADLRKTLKRALHALAAFGNAVANGQFECAESHRQRGLDIIAGVIGRDFLLHRSTEQPVDGLAGVLANYVPQR